ncbi:MAG: phospho-N-acetylmuramoyl-pentapeptide-transferase [Clostridiales bacterium]|nr:phospho-N-acetylmuramoyl-pentapeptide-transferase [Clostridiales bacterium]
MTASTFFITVLFTRGLIPRLKSLKMGQKILDIGPRWHKSKEGTPTMGGLAFMMSVLLCGLAFALVVALATGEDVKPFLFTLGLALLNGGIGVIDDLTKFRKRQNEGLTPGQKFFLQLLIAAAYLVFMNTWGYIDTFLYIPYFDIELNLGILYHVFALLLITGITNSANLTDGIDGLASSVTCVIGIFFAYAAQSYGSAPLGLLSGGIIGATLGFLVYNFYPARIFMGDTGSLFLGGLVVGAAFMINNPLIVVVAALIYIIETLSVMLQVGFFKLTCKRIFRMAPIHHHFEKCGWSERKVVAVFSLITLLACVLAIFGLRPTL